MLEFKNVSYQYDSEDFDIIDNLSFKIERGTFNSIIGISGCGKSTIFRLTNGLLKPKSGEITIDGMSIVGLKQYCGYMPQKDLLFPWLTVGENVAMPLRFKGKISNKRERAEAVLNDVGLQGCMDKMPHELSGGMRQRASFARTLLTDSELMLLDEPFSALDFLTRLSMQEWLLEQCMKYNKTILFITHDVDEAILLSDNIYVAESTPIKELKKIKVPLEYPRTRKQLEKVEILELRDNLIDKLRNQVSD